MPSSKEYLNLVLDSCGGLSTRAMMDEYVLYYGGKVVGGIYDNRVLVKPTPSAVALMPGAAYELPYEGAKPMLRVGNFEDRTFLAKLFAAVAADLPEPQKRKNKQDFAV